MGIPDASRGIRAELARAGKGQKDVAEWLDIPAPSVSKRMRGEIEWRLSELRTIAEKLGVPVSVLVDEAGQVPA